MTQFTLTFLGPFQVRAGATLVTDFHSDKARALLAYLALEPHEHDRTLLATLLWPAIDDQYARTNLRTTLYRLRQTLDRAAPGAGDQMLTVTRQTVQFNPASCVVDVLRFQGLLNQPLTGVSSPVASVELLTEAVALYGGELLLGFSVADAAPFEEWLLLRRELLQQQAMLAFQKLATAYEAAGQEEQAHTVAGRLLALDPYREETYRQIMRLLARMGQPGEALQLLERLRRLLHDEMGVAPSSETLTLAEEIVAGRYDKGAGERGDEAAREAPVTLSAPQLGAPTLKLDLRDVPDPGLFVGRAHERRQPAQWLLHDRCRGGDSGYWRDGQDQPGGPVPP
ncbi:MAG: BTAD domain-containing putative transcriptional regulator [Caldilineaceae bacterium]